MALTVAAIRLETTFLLVDSDLHYDERDQVLVAMSQELTETIMTTHIHFTLLLVFPPVFGMRWLTMVLVCGLVLVLFLPIWLNFASSLIFFPPHYMLAILFAVVVTAVSSAWAVAVAVALDGRPLLRTVLGRGL